MRMTLAAATIWLAAAPAHAQWVGTFGASPTDPIAATTTPTYKDQTVRTVAHVSLGGTSVRLRLSNELTPTPVRLGAVHVARWENGAIVPGTDRVVRFGNALAVTIPKNAAMLSDPVTLDVPALSQVAVSVYLPGETPQLTIHALAVQTGSVAAGDQTGAATMAGATPLDTRPLLAGIDVERPGATTVVTFGDSITDGQKSTVDANARYPDVLATALARAGRPVGVINAGINGNRLLSESKFGPNALARFDRDVLAQTGVSAVIVLLGINDIGHVPDTPTNTGEVIAALRQLAARGHERGLKVIGATLLPFENSPYWADSGETFRQAVNAFVRDGGAFDGVIDFDAVTRDPARPVRLRADFDSGDHLHPNDAGYVAMAAAVDQGLLSR